ncbi:MAG: hypothetical protein HUJ31_03780, partial [Pseudomonadales bacterium]|nr:hypothetical protein [Pseudomonadales bacterium]
AVDIDVTGGGNVRLGAAITTSGTAEATQGGNGCAVTINTADGTMSLNAITTDGGNTTAGSNNGGNGASVTVVAGGATGGLTLAGAISTIGGTSVGGSAGTDGSVTLDAGAGTLDGASQSISTGGGTIAFTGDSYANMDGTYSTTSSIDLDVNTAGKTVTLGTATGGDVSLSNAELTALASGGTLNIGSADAGAIVVDGVDVSGNNINIVSGSTIDDADDVGTSLKTTANITLTAGGAIGGANAAGLNVDAASVTVTSTAGNSVTITDVGTSDTVYDISTGGAGTVTLNQSANNLLVENITTTGNVVLDSAADILNNTGGTGIVGANLSADATGSVGTSSSLLATQVSTLDASGAGVFVGNTGRLAITDDGDADTSGIKSTGGVIVSASSPLVVDADVTDTSATGITLYAAEDGTDTVSDPTSGSFDYDNVDLNADVIESGTGNINIYAGDSINLQGTAGTAGETGEAIVSATSGSVLLSASTDFDGTTASNGNMGDTAGAGDIVMDDGAQVLSNAGNITLRAAGSISLGLVDADADNTSTVGNVNIDADYDGVDTGLSDNVGSITDSTAAESANVVGSVVTLDAG